MKRANRFDNHGFSLAEVMLTVAILVFYSMISLITVLIVDISYGIIDPRVRMGGKK